MRVGIITVITRAGGQASLTQVHVERVTRKASGISLVERLLLSETPSSEVHEY